MVLTRRGLLIASSATLCVRPSGLALASTTSVEATKLTVLADGHPLALWVKRPRAPRGVILLVHGRTWSALPNFDLHVGRRRDPTRVDWRREHEFGALDPAAVRTPTLLLHGARDPYVKMDAHNRLFTKLGTERKAWAVLPSADHAAHLESTQAEWIDSILDFVERS